jgi:hypothetical protein
MSPAPKPIPPNHVNAFVITILLASPQQQPAVERCQAGHAQGPVQVTNSIFRADRLSAW